MTGPLTILLSYLVAIDTFTMIASSSRRSSCLLCLQFRRSTVTRSSNQFISTTSTLQKDESNKANSTNTSAKSKKPPSSIEIENERIRQLLLDRDGGSASVPTRAGGWDSEMGRETSKQMHRVLDQSRVSKPGTSISVGEGESRFRFK